MSDVTAEAVGDPDAAGGGTPGRPDPSGAVPAGVTTQAETVLEVRDLHTHFPVRRSLRQRLAGRAGQVVRAVDGVSLRVARGEMVALVGESGCGKTTTVQTIQRMLDPTAGSIVVEGRDITRLGRRALKPVRRRMQVVYQDPYESLDPRFPVRRTVEEPLAVHKVGTAGDRRHRVRDALERAGLSPAELYLDRYPHELSGGQRQRVAIAASLVLDPAILLADEPVSMLDVSVRAGVLSLLDGLRREASMAVLMITHDLSTAAHFADRIAVMYLGRIVEQGPAREVIRDPRHPYTRALLAVVPRRDPDDRVIGGVLRGEAPNPLDIPTGCRFAARCPRAEDRCRVEDPLLRAADTPAAAHEVACHLA